MMLKVTGLAVSDRHPYMFSRASHQRSKLTLLRVTVMFCAGDCCPTRKLGIYCIILLAQQADMNLGVRQCSSHNRTQDVIA